MKTRLFLMLLIVVLGLAFAYPAPVQATKPVDDLEIDAELTMNSPTSAIGTFSISSPLLGIADCGAASQVFHIDMDDFTIHGTKKLVGAHGTIKIKFQAQITPSGAIGSFTIISGTGAYKKLHGVGSTFAAINGSDITAHYEGSAHID